MDFESIYNQYFRYVELYLLKLCADELLAEELTAQTFFKALHSLNRFRGDSDIRTWLCSIAKNCYYSHLRKQHRSLPMEESTCLETDMDVESMILERETADEIKAAVQNLPKNYRSVFILRVYGQLSFAEIGEILDKNQNWACVTYHRAKEKIRSQLEGMHYENQL